MNFVFMSFTIDLFSYFFNDRYLFVKLLFWKMLTNLHFYIYVQLTRFFLYINSGKRFLMLRSIYIILFHHFFHYTFLKQDAFLSATIPVISFLKIHYICNSAAVLLHHPVTPQRLIYLQTVVIFYRSRMKWAGPDLNRRNPDIHLLSPPEQRWRVRLVPSLELRWQHLGHSVKLLGPCFAV
jgi:hypothetical protein